MSSTKAAGRRSQVAIEKGMRRERRTAGGPGPGEDSHNVVP
jgi:hypothetical protein